MATSAVMTKTTMTAMMTPDIVYATRENYGISHRPTAHGHRWPGARVDSHRAHSDSDKSVNKHKQLTSDDELAANIAMTGSGSNVSRQWTDNTAPITSCCVQCLYQAIFC